MSFNDEVYVAITQKTLTTLRTIIKYFINRHHQETTHNESLSREKEKIRRKIH